jgi:hypothetical protein
VKGGTKGFPLLATLSKNSPREAATNLLSLESPISEFYRLFLCLRTGAQVGSVARKTRLSTGKPLLSDLPIPVGRSSATSRSHGSALDLCWAQTTQNCLFGS